MVINKWNFQMELIVKQLQQHGYAASFVGNDIKVKLTGLANPVLISHDVALDQYVLKTRDLLMGVNYSAMLFLGLYGSNESYHFFSSILVAISVFGFVGIVLTELKLTRIRQILESYNLKKS